MRRLFPIEEAFTISNEQDPLGVVCVLHISNGPAPDRLEKLLQKLQSRHPVLQMEIIRRRGGYYFRNVKDPPPVSISTILRQGKETWKSTAETMLNTRFRQTCPMMYCHYVYGADQPESEILLGFHHAGVDGAILRLILHDILCLSGNVPLETKPETDPLTPVTYPSSIRNLPGLFFRQIRDEFSYRKKGINAPVPESSENSILGLELSVETTRKLKLIAGRRGFTLNTMVLSAMSIGLMRARYPDCQSALLRLISFVNLRPHFNPHLPEWAMGCFISMLRFTVPYGQKMTIWDLGKTIRKALAEAGRRKDPWVMAAISKWLIRLALRFQGPRLGVAALSYLGKLELDRNYGDIELHHVRAFITNNRLGPEFSGFGKTLFGGLSLDCTFLRSEMQEDQALAVIKEVRNLLEKTANSVKL